MVNIFEHLLYISATRGACAKCRTSDKRVFLIISLGPQPNLEVVGNQKNHLTASVRQFF